MRTRNSETGIILLEVMLATVLLVVGSMAVFQSFRTSIRAAEDSRDEFRAVLLMEGQMGLLEKTGQLDESLDKDEILGPVAWAHEAVQVGQDYGIEHRLNLSWGEGRHANRLELSAYLAK